MLPEFELGAHSKRTPILNRKEIEWIRREEERGTEKNRERTRRWGFAMLRIKIDTLFNLERDYVQKVFDLILVVRYWLLELVNSLPIHPLLRLQIEHHLHH